jgi:hypothetical protein
MSDSVWSLSSPHPNLENFYSGTKDGKIYKFEQNESHDGFRWSEIGNGCANGIVQVCHDDIIIRPKRFF